MTATSMGMESRMSTASRMLETYPPDLGGIAPLWRRASRRPWTARWRSRSACRHPRLSEAAVQQLTGCVRTNRDCADVCYDDWTSAVLRRRIDANLTRATLQACAHGPPFLWGRM